MHNTFQKYSDPLNSPFCSNHELICVLLGIYVIDQHNLGHNFAVERK